MTVILIPGSWLTKEQKQSIKFRAAAVVRKRAAELNNVSEEQIDVREAVVGDTANATDFCDLSFKTAATSGQEEWTEDAADLTAGDLSNVISTTLTDGYGRLGTGKVMGIFGIADLTPTGDLTMVKYEQGSDVKAIIETEPIYVVEGAGATPEGFYFDDVTREPVVILFEGTQQVKIYQNHKTSADKNVVHYALIGELKGTRITSETKSVAGVPSVKVV